MSQYIVPVREINTCADVFRIAAEYIDHSMRNHIYGGYDYTTRRGCCAAFASIRIALRESGRDREADLVYAAQRAFEKIYYVDGNRSAKGNAYWMGSRNNAGMQRRINALLASAEATE